MNENVFYQMKGILLFTQPGKHTQPCHGGLHVIAYEVGITALTQDEI